MNKKQLHHVWTKLRLVKPEYFLVLALLSGGLAIGALRANNQHMIDLREAVWAADKAGTDVQTPLKELQAYVTSHMNTDLNAGRTPVYPPIQLKYTYERQQQANRAQFTQANSQLYSEAQKICEQQNPTDFSGRNRIPCIQQYVLGHTTQKPAAVPEGLYKFAFVSPPWSPDLAGWSLVACFLCCVAAIGTFIANRWLRTVSG